MELENITLAAYETFLEQTNALVLADLNAMDGGDILLGIQLECRDDEDSVFVIGWDRYRLFPRFAPAAAYMRREYEGMMDDGLDGEPMEDRFYWRLAKYRNFGEEIRIVYEAYFLLNGRLDAVCYRPDKTLGCAPDTEGEKQLAATQEQMTFAPNVELPFRPGDVLRVDARPYGKPFYAVFGAEHNGDLAYFAWTQKEYGYFKRRNYCLYRSEDRDGLGITQLTDNYFTDYVPFPHAPLERLTLVPECDDPLLMKVSQLLKEDTDIFYTWLEIDETSHYHDVGLEKLIFLENHE